MLLSFRVPVLLCHAEVDHMNDVSSFRAGSTDQEIVRLDVAIDEVFLVDRLNSRKLGFGLSAGPRATEKRSYHLFGDHHHSLDGESPVAMVEEIFQARAQEIDHQDVVQTFLPEIIHIRDASYITLASLTSWLLVQGH